METDIIEIMQGLLEVSVCIFFMLLLCAVLLCRIGSKIGKISDGMKELENTIRNKKFHEHN
jgi:hypothetical protein